ncbi:MAG TPA: alpha/beta fold hydrolase [Ilumatobacteraceae bacterium]|jgi:carboxylesterase|nr:alpha/beta fold hydrolase [Ilumatobacteraceae bacterium]
MTRVLCLHGLGGTGATMWPIVAACIDANFTTLAPTLPGHGTDPADLVGVTWDDWLEAARGWEADVVVGQSMGAGLALQLCAEHRCAAAVCINPVAEDPDAMDGLEWRLSRGQSWVEVGPSAVGEIAYERLPIEAVIEMTRGVSAMDLSAVDRPVLLVTSAEDDVVDPASSDVIAAALRGDVRRLRLRHSGHVATLDKERDVLQRAVVEFVNATVGVTK